MSRIQVLSSRNLFEHVSLKVAEDAETAVLRVSGGKLLAPVRQKALPPSANVLERCLARWRTFRQARGLGVLSERVALHYMAMHHHFDPVLTDPTRQKIVYLFDTWEPAWPGLQAWMTQWRSVSGAFFSSSQAARHFSRTVDYPVHWLPQAADPDEFRRFELGGAPKRQRLIVNIGRVNPVLHEFFLDFSRKHHFRYLYEAVPGQVAFASREEYVGALSQAAIVVVHPRNLAYPAVTGVVSMLTARYFEAYNSGAVVCGYKPSSSEFSNLLLDMPFVKFDDPSGFEKRLLEALASPQLWDEAKASVRTHHTWDHRAREMIKLAGW